MAPPKWAQDLLLDALTWWESQGNDIPNITLTWRRGQQSWSSGRAFCDRIVVTAGSDRIDTKVVLLHETAHVLNPGVHHGARFWDTAWTLYRWARLPVRYCRQREHEYRGATLAYARSRKPSGKSMTQGLDKRKTRD